MKEYITHVALDAHKKEHQVCMGLPGEEAVREFDVLFGADIERGCLRPSINPSTSLRTALRLGMAPVA